MPIPAHAAVMNKKAHQAKALTGFIISAVWKPAPMASRGQCTPGFFKYCKAFGVNAGKKLAVTLPNETDSTAIFMNSHGPGADVFSFQARLPHPPPPIVWDLQNVLVDKVGCLVEICGHQWCQPVPSKPEVLSTDGYCSASGALWRYRASL